jgi:sulfate adenylyltransferase subunit 2
MEMNGSFDLNGSTSSARRFGFETAAINGQKTYTLAHLEALESEAIHILREVAAECRHPVLLFSGGKDSVVLLRLAEKAFRPARFPFPLLHIDTGHNFPEVIAFRDKRAAELGEHLVVRSVEDSIRQGKVILKSPTESRNVHQSVTLLDAIGEHGFDACIRRPKRLCPKFTIGWTSIRYSQLTPFRSCK